MQVVVCELRYLETVQQNVDSDNVAHPHVVPAGPFRPTSSCFMHRDIKFGASETFLSGTIDHSEEPSQSEACLLRLV